MSVLFPFPSSAPSTLTPADVQALRAKVSTAASKRTWSRPPVWVQIQGGPLDGIRAALTESEAMCQRVGWCALTSTGPVQVMHDNAGGVLQFEGLH